MPLLNQSQSRALVFWYFASRGRFPTGTTVGNWQDVTMKQMEFDDPPLGGDPDFEKKKTALDLQAQYNALGIAVDSPLAVLKKVTATMKDLWQFLHKSQEEIPHE